MQPASEHREIPSPNSIAILGVGALGASVGLAAKRKWPDAVISGWFRQPEKLQYAIQVGYLHHGGMDVAEVVRDADVVVVATPVGRIADFAVQALRHIRPGAIVTDVGSTKLKLTDQVLQRSENAGRFVPAHPIAGTEKTGIDAAFAEMFDDQLTIVTPTSDCDQDAQSLGVAFWRGLGCRVHLMPSQQHDEMCAMISHVPNLAARCLVDTLEPMHDWAVGSGFLSTTRTAKGDTAMWRDICLHNPDEIHAQLGRLIESLTKVQRAIGDGDTAMIEQFLATSQERRQTIQRDD
ncbi:MAG: prephenate dehydrogenase/arogenate dehydrogenase family protein [Planctomycetota bacterium]